jgi:DNA-binding transcriptional ArsR family regulator
MSNLALNWAWTVKTGSAAAKSVLVALADRARPDGVAWPSITDIARRTELSERAVQKHLAGLAELRLITIERRSGRTNVFRLHLAEGGAASAPRPPHDMHPRGEPAAPKPSLNPQEEPTPHPPHGGGKAVGSRSKPPKSRHASLTAEKQQIEIAIAWNEIMGRVGNAGCQEETMETRHYRRLVESAIRRLGSVATARRLFKAMADDPFYRGESSTDWRPTLGWALAQKNLSSLMERFEIWRNDD